MTDQIPTHFPASEVSDATRRLIAEADAFLLDFNGTLSDDEDLLAELIADISAQELGVALPAERYFKEFAGFTEEHMFSALASESTHPTLSASQLFDIFNERYLERTAERSRITPEARAFVEAAAAAGKHLAMVTSASRKTVVPALKQAGINGMFKEIIALEDISSPKPDPECYLRAAAELALEPSRAVAFEDSRTGMRAAIGAGVPVVAVLSSLSAEEASTLTRFTVPAPLSATLL